ncbi:MAG: AMIN domain-containing protein [Desulfatirhabdiaceae bacterium]
MRNFHSSRASWFMLLIFLISVVTFFVLAAGRDVGLIPEALTAKHVNPFVVIGQAVSRLKETVFQKEQDMVRGAGKVLEQTGQKLENMANHATVTENTRHSQAFVAPISKPAVPKQTGSDTPRHDKPFQLTAHKFAEIKNGFVATFTTDQKIHDITVSYFNNPARWVIDLPGKWHNKTRRFNKLPNGFINQVVLGDHETFLRIVFHFRDPARTQGNIPTITTSQNGFVITIPKS